MSRRPHAHENTPRHPYCGGPSTRYNSEGTQMTGADLFCAACGDVWEGTLADVAKAEKSDAAWERKQQREERPNPASQDAAKLARYQAWLAARKGT